MAAQHLSKEERAEIIKEDFRFLDEVQIQKVNGKPMMSDGTMPHNVSHVIYEKEFVEKWLMGFALGNYRGINYFKADEWFSLSANGTRAVMVVDDDHKPLLVIAPMITHNLSPREFQLLQQASRYIHSNSVDTIKANDPNANLGIARKIKETLAEKKRITLTEMVIPEFYEKHGIIPEVEQQVYYIKDNLLQGAAPIDDINRLRHVLYANYRKENISQEEFELVERLTRNTPLVFQFNPECLNAVKVNATKGVAAETRETPVDPLEC
jgi:hypothetical protein